MSAQEIVASLLQLLGIVTAWPIILLIIILVFRHEVRQLLPALAKRLKKADIAGTSFEFTEVAVKALQDSIDAGAEEFKGRSDELVSFVKKQVEKLPEATATAQLAENRLPLNGRSILWVDDNPFNNTYEESFFRQLGAKIKQATSTAQALHYLEPGLYDLIISDVHRDENGRSNPSAGYELLDKVRQRKIQTPFVFYTSSVARVDPDRSKLANGVEDSPGRLRDLVLSLLQH